MKSDSKISFLISAKDEEKFIAEAIDAISGSGYDNWEIIVIDDHSTDKTADIVKEYSLNDERIKFAGNRLVGKVAAFNQAFEMSTGDVIKCHGADDVLDKAFFKTLSLFTEYDALCHDFFITSQDLTVQGISRINAGFVTDDFNDCLRNLKSLASGAWYFTRNIAEIIFPVPDQLPFEDIWFSLIIKRYTKKIKYIPEPLYYYRQNEGQTYGGMLNFKADIVRFRANRMIKVIDFLESEAGNRLTDNMKEAHLFDEMKKYYEILSNSRVSTKQIVVSGLQKQLLLKAILYTKLNWLVPVIQRFLWFYRFWTK